MLGVVLPVVINACAAVLTQNTQVEYRRHQDNLGAAARGEGGGGYPTPSPGFGPRGGPPGASGAWSRNRGASRGMGGGDDHHKVRRVVSMFLSHTSGSRSVFFFCKRLQLSVLLRVSLNAVGRETARSLHTSTLHICIVWLLSN